MIYIFVDTNFFMQHTQYDHLPWSELFDDYIHIIIPRKVISEIDKHKNSPNKRISKRANNFTSLLKELRNNEITVTRGAHTLTISIGERVNSYQPKLDFLNLSEPDDCIVNEALCWEEHNPDKHYCILTADIHMTLICMDCNVPYVDIPDTWRLPEEKDDRDREIADLKKQMSKSPLIDIKVKDSFITVDIPEYKELSKNEIKELCNYIFSAFPEQAEFDTSHTRKKGSSQLTVVAYDGRGAQWIYPSENEIKIYKNKYRAWQSNIIDCIAKMHLTLKNHPTRFNFFLELENSGDASAENLELKIETHGGIQLIPPGEKKDWQWGYKRGIIPLLPDVPQKRREVEVLQSENRSLSGAYELLRNGALPREKKVNEFYWKKFPETPMNIWELSCAELRHKMGGYSRELTLLVSEEGYTKDLALKITVSAKNLSALILKTIPVRPNKIEGDLFSRLSEAIRAFIDKYQGKKLPGFAFPTAILGAPLMRDKEDEKLEIF
jgi:rRNA-processing protein FCF1